MLVGVFVEETNPTCQKKGCITPQKNTAINH